MIIELCVSPSGIFSSDPVHDLSQMVLKRIMYGRDRKLYFITIAAEESRCNCCALEQVLRTSQYLTPCFKIIPVKEDQLQSRTFHKTEKTVERIFFHLV